jgi:hypothetical protein
MRAENQISGKYRMNVDLDRELARELRKALIDEGKTLSEWVREQVVWFLRVHRQERGGE